ncbi:UPF0489 family protein [Clostridium bowmanii]|uniref:UPF0489 family protein n=1 Tax=Clostridium bowmanii TaxID=132925 RepID=UPI001C0D9C52|nr:UPF0489 family protein [Clostridium bowmanii]MBU3191895.1 UPF0489 family protein [Clostridium bowmanii]MCA1076112.1 UPF0489 family protein [Clostridium bowmanii]
MKILDLDLDFFQMDVSNWGNDYGKRLNSEYTQPWNKEKLVSYLETNLGLRKNKKIDGRIYTHHDEAFYFWRELILKGNLCIPFDLVHVDAHADLGFGDSSFQYITNEYLYLDYELKMYPENLTCKKNSIKHFSYANYLIFAVACNWINTLDYVLHLNNYKGCDFSKIHFKNYDIETNIMQIKKYKQYEDLGVAYGKKIEDIEIIEFEKEVPFRCINQEDVLYDGNFNFIGLSISPGYTVKESDELIEVIKEYINEI